MRANRALKHLLINWSVCGGVVVAAFVIKASFNTIFVDILAILIALVAIYCALIALMEALTGDFSAATKSSGSTHDRVAEALRSRLGVLVDENRVLSKQAVALYDRYRSIADAAHANLQAAHKHYNSGVFPDFWDAAEATFEHLHEAIAVSEKLEQVTARFHDNALAWRGRHAEMYQRVSPAEPNVDGQSVDVGESSVWSAGDPLKGITIPADAYQEIAARVDAEFAPDMIITFPIGSASLDTLSLFTAMHDDLEALVYDAKKSPVAATIFEQRKTTNAINMGFFRLTQAVSEAAQDIVSALSRVSVTLESIEQSTAATAANTFRIAAASEVTAANTGRIADTSEVIAHYSAQTLAQVTEQSKHIKQQASIMQTYRDEYVHRMDRAGLAPDGEAKGIFG